MKYADAGVVDEVVVERDLQRLLVRSAFASSGAPG